LKNFLFFEQKFPFLICFFIIIRIVEVVDTVVTDIEVIVVERVVQVDQDQDHVVQDVAVAVVVEVVLNMTADTIDIIQQVVPNQDQELVVVQDVTIIIIINLQQNNNDMIELDLDLNHVIAQVVVVEKINIIIIIRHLMIAKVKTK